MPARQSAITTMFNDIQLHHFVLQTSKKLEKTFKK